MILIYADKISSRLEYSAQLIFQDILNSDVRFTDNVIFFKQSELPKINYSATRFGSELFIEASSLLFENTIAMPGLNPVEHEGITGFFATTSGSFLPFDPFASVFVVVTRMEEYIPGSRDKFGRFDPEQSILCRYGLQEKAVVNRWALMLATGIRGRYPQFVFYNQPFRFLSTIDVDNAYAFLAKGFLRTAGSALKSLLRKGSDDFITRIKVLLHQENDPFDAYSYLFEQFRGNEKEVRFFFLMRNEGKYDRQVSLKNNRFRNLVKQIHSRYETGIHPSFLSSVKREPEMIAREKKNLEEITGTPVTISRQHFLMLEFPFTYSNLLESGITCDYSMGFAQLAGFRAGICTPYFFYDLAREKSTTLKIIPFQVMDVTLRQYMGLSPEEASRKIEILLDEVRETGGIFCSIWHNETLHDRGFWKGYRKVFEDMNQLGFYYAGR